MREWEAYYRASLLSGHPDDDTPDFDPQEIPWKLSLELVPAFSFAPFPMTNRLVLVPPNATSDFVTLQTDDVRADSLSLVPPLPPVLMKFILSQHISCQLILSDVSANCCVRQLRTVCATVDGQRKCRMVENKYTAADFKTVPPQNLTFPDAVDLLDDDLSLSDLSAVIAIDAHVPSTHSTSGGGAGSDHFAFRLVYELRMGPLDEDGSEGDSDETDAEEGTQIDGAELEEIDSDETYAEGMDSQFDGTYEPVEGGGGGLDPDETHAEAQQLDDDADSEDSESIELPDLPRPPRSHGVPPPGFISKRRLPHGRSIPCRRSTLCSKESCHIGRCDTVNRCRANRSCVLRRMHTPPCIDKFGRAIPDDFGDF